MIESEALDFFLHLSDGAAVHIPDTLEVEPAGHPPILGRDLPEFIRDNPDGSFCYPGSWSWIPNPVDGPREPWQKEERLHFEGMNIVFCRHVVRISRGWQVDG